MERHSIGQYQAYSWHQSHDQATVLLLVPYDTTEEDMVVMMEESYLLAGVRGQPPVIKGRLYGNVSASSSWQLEPRNSRLSARERTTSTTSTASTQSSYAFVSDPEISSSFAASLENSDAEELVTPSPAYSSPLSSSVEERGGFPFQRQRTVPLTSQPVSPGIPARSLTSSFSSLESLHSHQSGRLLTLHLEKEQSAIWPSLIVGPVPDTLSPCAPSPFAQDTNLEHKYNMDPTSLVLVALELYDIRRDKEEAFECFARAWHQAHVPSATMRLVTYYMPLHASFDLSESEEPAHRGSFAYCSQSIGGPVGLAQLYLEAGLIHLEGASSTLLSSSYSTLSSIRLPPQPQAGESGTDAWRRDRELASRYFDRARTLQPDLDVPFIPSEGEESLQATSSGAEELEMPSMEIHPSVSEDVHAVGVSHVDTDATLRRRRKKEELAVMNEIHSEEADNSWYLYIPGLVGAGTALLVVGVVGALSFSTWRRNQGS